MTGREIGKTMATVLIGSYTHSLPHVVASGIGISMLEIDGATGHVELVATMTDVRNPTYLALSADGQKLYCVEELAEEDGASLVISRRDHMGEAWSVVGRVPVFGDAPCHVSLDARGEWLFVSNYQSGNLVAYRLGEDGMPMADGIDIRRSGRGPNIERQEGPHVHQATASPDNRHVLICDAGTDEIARYAMANGKLDRDPDLQISAKPGSLPRHLCFSQDGRHVFVLHELCSSIASYAYGPEGMRFVAEVSTLPPDFSGGSAGAAIRLHPGGRFLYASNRGHDSIFVCEIDKAGGELKPVGRYGTRGRTPRDFAIDPAGSFLVAANQDSSSLTVFSIDQATGALEPVGEPYVIGTPVCVLFADG